MLSMFRRFPVGLRQPAIIVFMLFLASPVLACTLGGSSSSISASPTATAVLPTATSAPPTATAVLPTATSAPPTATSVPLTATPLPPGNLAITVFCVLPGTNTIVPCITPYSALCLSGTYFYFHFQNIGGQAVHWTSTVTFPGNGPGSYILLSPASGTVNPGQTVTVKATGSYGGDVDFTISWGSQTKMYSLLCAMP